MPEQFQATRRYTDTLADDCPPNALFAAAIAVADQPLAMKAGVHVDARRGTSLMDEYDAPLPATMDRRWEGDENEREKWDQCGTDENAACRAIEDAFAAAIGKSAVAQLEQARNSWSDLLDFDDFTDESGDDSE